MYLADVSSPKFKSQNHFADNHKMIKTKMENDKTRKAEREKRLDHLMQGSHNWNYSKSHDEEICSKCDMYFSDYFYNPVFCSEKNGDFSLIPYFWGKPHNDDLRLIIGYFQKLIKKLDKNGKP